MTETVHRYLDADGVPTPYIDLAVAPNPAYPAARAALLLSLGWEPEG